MYLEKKGRVASHKLAGRGYCAQRICGVLASADAVWLPPPPQALSSVLVSKSATASGRYKAGTLARAVVEHGWGFK